MYIAKLFFYTTFLLEVEGNYSDFGTETKFSSYYDGLLRVVSVHPKWKTCCLTG